MQKLGFTLAEVLITLVIIGIIAAITIPTLMGNKQDKEIIAGLKKNYSVFQQFLTRYYMDNGVRLKPYNQPGGFTHYEIYPIMRKYIVNLKACGIEEGVVALGCINESKINTVYKTYSGTGSLVANSFDDGQFVMIDGSQFFINNDGDGTFFITDVNGSLKKPNILGKDLFLFQLTNDGKLLPGGAPGTRFADESTYCSPTSNNSYNGAGCTAKMLQK